MTGKRPGKFIKFILYVIVVVLINGAGLTLFFRADLTKNDVYSISEASRHVVSTLSEPLTINVFFTKNLPAPHNNTERYLHDLLREYANYANRYFNYRFYDVSPDEGDITKEAKENQALARNYGIFPIQIQAIEKDEVKFQKAYMGLVILHGDLMERIPTVTGTDGLEYKLTMAMQKLNNKISALLRLEDKIRVRLFLSSTLYAVAPLMRLNAMPRLPETLERIVKKLNEKHYGKLQFESIDPSRDQKGADEARKLNLMNLKWPSLSDGKIEAGEGTVGLVLQRGERTVTVPFLRAIRVPLLGTQYEIADGNRLEEMISENVESLIDINEGLGVLAGHGALDLLGTSSDQRGRDQGEGTRNFRSLVSRNYTMKPVNLKEEPLAESFNCLVLPGPTETFSDYELFEIDQFLMRGKSLAILVDRFHEVAPPGQQGAPAQAPRIVPFDTGLEKLLSHYGIQIRKSYVMDENCFKQRMPAQFGGGERPIYFAPLIKNELINHDPGFMKQIKALVVLKVSPLEIDSKRVQDLGLKVHRLFSSSEKSWEMAERISLNPMMLQPPSSKEAMKSFPLAYVIEGRFESYFAGKEIPEKPETKAGPEQKEQAEERPGADLSKIERKGEFLSKGRSGKIFIIASSEMLKDNMVDEEGRGPDAMFLLNVVDYLNGREEIALMRSKEQRLNPLAETKGGTRTFLKAFSIAGLPLLVILFGLGVWFRRHSRKRSIQMMFGK
jgi:gliding motility-associatede transport system auxiliary component